ncbi:hypothetical protein SE15_09400 [Thermanaerothrix daxensis]|uniref:N-formylglutamate amidohydrolase n=1 Tax=Thermanaerothrix daxensis TaxID=869279 RepID=A0A0P6YJ30_9CHLR|nr:hypothetical protein [Thermanaerothrix daxensis]KPL82380.1 hypothetical protein SE15_09400 [Thermanaerothrix daxensis]
MEAWLERLVALESEVAYKTPPAPGERYFRFLPGRLPILLSAPHGAAHVREGRLKEEEDYTAALVRLVAELSGAHALFTWRKADPDPGFYPETPYKRALRQIVRRYSVRFIVDVHGCAAYRDFGLALGTLHGQSCPGERRLILSLLSRFGFRESGPWLSVVDVDHTFTANGRLGQETITRFAWQRLGVPAAQFELHPQIRVVRRLSEATEREPFQGDRQMILRTVVFFQALVEALALRLGKDAPEREGLAAPSSFEGEDDAPWVPQED